MSHQVSATSIILYIYLGIFWCLWLFQEDGVGSWSIDKVYAWATSVGGDAAILLKEQEVDGEVLHYLAIHSLTSFPYNLKHEAASYLMDQIKNLISPKTATSKAFEVNFVDDCGIIHLFQLKVLSTSMYYS